MRRFATLEYARAVELNLHAAVDAADPKAIAQLFLRSGWRMRKSGWVEYEITSDDAELIVEAARPVLIHGPSTRAGYDAMLAILRPTQLRYQMELYDGATCIVSDASAEPFSS